MKIGVFDSGRGGKYVADKLQELFPADTVLYVNDAAHLPYGDKSADEIRTLTDTAIQPLLEQECDCIVIACNSATTNAIAFLRAAHPSVFFIGIEPMLKPAALQSQTQSIAVCATPATLSSARYNELKARFTHGISIYEPNCSLWAQLIETHRQHEIPLVETIQEIRAHNADVVVLACTHYHYLKSDIQRLAPVLTVLEPTDAIARRIVDQVTAVRSRLR